MKHLIGLRCCWTGLSLPFQGWTQNAEYLHALPLLEYKPWGGTSDAKNYTLLIYPRNGTWLGENGKAGGFYLPPLCLLQKCPKTIP